MAAKKEQAAPQEGYVEVFVPRGGPNEDPNVFIGINGKNYLLPKGKTSLVPQEVAFEYHRAQAAQEALDDKIDEMIRASQGQ